MAKVKTQETKKPTGLTITRRDNKYIFSWKKGETYGDGQRLEYSYSYANSNQVGSYISSTLTVTGTSKTVTINAQGLKTVGFKVRGKASDESEHGHVTVRHPWSDWREESFTVGEPKTPNLTKEWDIATPNKTTFKFTAEETDHRPYDHCVWQAILVADCPANYKAASLWKNATKHTINGLSGTVYNTAESAMTGSNTRIVRIKAVGQGGESDWDYSYHVYATPYAPVIKDWYANYNTAKGWFDVELTWTLQNVAMQHPVDTTTVQQIIGVPTAGMGLPTGSSWEDVSTPVNKKDNLWQGVIERSGGLQDDECLFLRVKAQHDDDVNASSYIVASCGTLAMPTAVSTTPNSGTHTIAVTVTPATTVPDANTAIIYREPNVGITGIMAVAPHGTTYPINVVVPAWTDNPGDIGAFNFVGSYTLKNTASDGVKSYSIDTTGWESDTFWANTPKAPSVSVAKVAEETAQLTWSWPWEEATNAEISWADHEDAWASTDEPQTYDVRNIHAASWNISGLTAGKVWYFRVRLYYGDGDTEVYGTYSNTVTLDLSSAPAKPVLTLSQNTIAQEGSFTASWVYISTDGTDQSYAEIGEKNGATYDVIATASTAQSVEITPSEFETPWATGSKHDLAVKVYSESGLDSAWSDVETVLVAEPLTCTIAQDSLVYDDIPVNPETVTGDPATFESDPDDIKDITSLEVSLTPHQAGTPWQDSTIYQTPYLFRKVPSINHSINSRYTTLVGASGVVNQLFYAQARAETSGVTISTTGNAGEIRIHGTATGSAWFQMVLTGRPVLGHKYYLDKGSNSTLFSITNDNGGINTGAENRYTIGAPTTNQYLYIFVPSGNQIDVTVRPQFIDLTQWFGSNTIPDRALTLENNTAGSGVAWLKSYNLFTKYIPYNAGTLESVNPSAMNTVGFNQWDEEWETGGISNQDGTKWSTSDRIRSKNFIRILPSTSYYWKAPTVIATIAYYDGGYNFISALQSSTQNATYTTPSNAYYAKFNMPNTYGNTYNHDICINLHYDGSRDGEYEQYNAHEYAVEDVELRGLYKLDANNNIVADGDTYPADGTVTRNFRIVTYDGSEDENWGKEPAGWQTSGLNAFYLLLSNADKGKYVSTSEPHPILCSHTYISVPWSYSSVKDGSNYGVIAFTAQGTYLELLADYNSVDAFKDSLASKPLSVVYELATPTTESADSYQTPMVCDNWGTEEWVDTRTVPMPVGNRSTYADIYEITGTSSVTATVADDYDDPTVSTDYTTALGQTVYEGTVDVVSGKLTDGTGHLAGTFVDTGYGTNAQGIPYLDIRATGCINNEAGISNQFEWITQSTQGRNGAFRTYGGNNPTITVYSTAFTSRAQAVALLESWGTEFVYPLAEPVVTDLTPTQVSAIAGTNYVWSEQGTVTVDIADAVEQGYFLTEMPLTVTVVGAGTEGITTMKIVRAENYAMERPDEKDYNGYEGDLVIQLQQAGEDQMTVQREQLIGRFDDGAKYRIVATLSDPTTNQSAEATKDFVVRWNHQAVKASGTAVIDGDIAKITPTKPTGADNTDHVDIYRLSADAPELLAENVQFGETYVDPYPTIGDMGGYRLVLVTANGDYITTSNEPSWRDISTNYDTPYQFIDFDGQRLDIRYNATINEKADKTFDRTHYLGGSIQGDWVEGVEGNGSITGVIPYDEDPDTYEVLRQLKRYAGLCHVRTKTGSNYTANVNVDDSTGYSNPGGVHEANLDIQQVDNPTTDGVLLSDWEVSE